MMSLCLDHVDRQGPILDDLLPAGTSDVRLPAVSIVIPCHNYGGYIAMCIDSVLAQTLPADRREIIVIDDASTDSSWDVVQRYRDVAGVRLFREERNRGYVAVYRRGMDMANAPFLLPLDADDYIADPDALRSQLELMGDQVGFVHSATLEVDAEGRPIRTRKMWRGTGVVRSRVAFARLLMGNSVQHTGTLIRRSAYRAVGGYDPSLFNSIDWDLWLRIARRYDVGHIDRPLYAYRLHGANMHRQRTATSTERDAVLAEVLRVVERASEGVERSLRRRARAQALVSMASFHFAGGRGGEGARALARAMRADATIASQRVFWDAVARLVVSGTGGYRVIRALRRSAR